MVEAGAEIAVTVAAPAAAAEVEDEGGGGADDSGPGACRSAIVFVSTVAACQQVAEMLVECAGTPNTATSAFAPSSGSNQWLALGQLASSWRLIQSSLPEA